jgi:glycerol-3-phosphate acyltransferase PlsY
MLYFYHVHGAVTVLILSIVVIWRHKENISRLRSGNEPRIGQKKAG